MVSFDTGRGAMRDRDEMIRGRVRRAGLASGLAVLAGLATAAPALAASNRCETAVKERLAQMSIDPEDVDDIHVAARIANQRGGSVSGYDGWADLKSCHGSIVLRLDRRCRVKDVYSRGECKFPDLPHY
jgi:hypothetical protein